MTASTHNRSVAIWLLSGCFLIFSMVVIGGITRLTGSGLSITEWNVIMGTIPPMNQEEWQEAFDKYKQIPQYTEVNSYFGVEEFKSIFWWEFIHRLVGRLIGIVFLFPFIYFLVTKKMDGATIRKSIFLFALGGLQGFLGWFMVKSGLTELTSVSHIRLAIHLTTAFITFGFTFWFALQLLEKEQPAEKSPVIRKWSVVLLAVLTVQLIYGAFVAGLHAGKMFNTFPLMNGDVFPVGGWVSAMGLKNIFDNPAAVQFIHRFFAFAVVFVVARIYWEGRTEVLSSAQRKSIMFIVATVIVQFLLGVFTVLYQAPIALSSIHQIGAFFLFMATILVVFRFRLR